ncbi:ADP-dependent NAD(P)H-hydrate dehydratase [Streptomyces lavenduligriseus]|uniref:NAD(P)H-hydrate dehydratase n=1 Tax=Streptomyces lavenduligriseus TaxID=67315 RepID=A0ABT0P4T1_9ACTN|nr:ADP/ATP-dependent (S)-NAD(P)H-hydrate dehydratase [Streptomyces lavenduligriseus]MCL3998748.1 NAD(P)H-hydrate dehydratase [Streptomyces lavenduligriseus]
MKGDGGMVLVVGGSQMYGAPPYLAGLGALRAGTDRVYTLAPSSAAAAAAALDMHVLPVRDKELAPADVEDLVRVSDAVEQRLAETAAAGRVVWLVGPGLGGSPVADRVLEALCAARTRGGGRSAAVVVDGSLGGGEQGRQRIAALGTAVVLLNRAEAAALAGPGHRPVPVSDLVRLADRTGATAVVTKDRVDRVVTSSGVVHQITAGDPSLAKSGSGDVLAGVTAGLLAQGLPAPQAAALACYLVGTAGQRLARRTGPGWLPSDLPDALAGPMRELATSRARLNRIAQLITDVPNRWRQS